MYLRSVLRACVLPIFIACTLGNGMLQAAIIRVPADRATIQAGINAAVNGDVVQVSPGTYVENLNFNGKAIRVVSEQGPQVTIIDGNQAGSVVSFLSGESLQSVLSGFTIRNGRTSSSGGGIQISNSSPTITGNVITNNTAGSGGGGISSSFGSPLIQGNTINNNGQIPGWSGGVGGGGIAIVGASSAQVLKNVISSNSWASASGGGITLFAAGTPTLQNNSILYNTAYSQGGGIDIVNQSDAAIFQNLIIGNSAPTGGAIYWLVPSGARGPFLLNNTIVSNTVFADGFDAQAQLTNNIIVSAPGQAAVYCGNFGSSVPLFSSNDIVSSSGPAYAGICADQTGLNGNLSADPLFKSASRGDYHLQVGSPAIDSGSAGKPLQLDFDGAPRPVDGNADGVARFDMGIYEAPAIDAIPPTTTSTSTPPPNNAGWNRTNVTVTLSASDNLGGSGVEYIRYWLTGAQQSPVVNGGNPSSVAVTAQGITTVGYYAVDNAGNVETSKSLAVRIDATRPVISGMPAPGCTLSPAKHQLIQVATITASDALSGVASLNVTAVSSEPDSGTGGGDIAGDIVINGGVVSLRAERTPSGKGRVYTITATANDLAGNTTTATATCSVPK